MEKSRDLFLDITLISGLFDEESLKTMFYSAEELYMIDKPGLLRYANRRGRKADIEGLVPELFEREKSIEEKINSDKSRICYEVSRIVESLPESQRKLFDCLQCGMTQPQIKDELEVTPQAVDQRLNRLFKAIARELDKRCGFNEEYIRKIYYYKSEFRILQRIAEFM